MKHFLPFNSFVHTELLVLKNYHLKNTLLIAWCNFVFLIDLQENDDEIMQEQAKYSATNPAYEAMSDEEIPPSTSTGTLTRLWWRDININRYSHKTLMTHLCQYFNLCCARWSPLYASHGTLPVLDSSVDHVFSLLPHESVGMSLHSLHILYR